MTTDNCDTRNQKINQLLDLIQGVAESTGSATDTILTLCESMTPDTMDDAITQIYQECAVQDLTNQRLMKMTRLLEQIRSNQFTDDDALLEGPQRAHTGLNQDSIDNILGSSE